MNTKKQASIEVHKQLVRDGEYKSARRLLRAILNNVKMITISENNDTDWTLGDYLCGNKFKHITIQ